MPIFLFFGLTRGVCSLSSAFSKSSNNTLLPKDERVELVPRFEPLRVMSRNRCRDLLVVLEIEPELPLVRGVKKRLNRLGVIGGSLFSRLLPVLETMDGGDDGGSAMVDSPFSSIVGCDACCVTRDS